MLDLYDHPDLYDVLQPVGEHLPYYLELARNRSGGSLELAVGTGLIAVPIAVAGCPIVGIDRSTAMLMAARTRAATAGVALPLVAADMRNVELDRQFGLVFAARNSLLHLTSSSDLLAAFACVRRHLAPGGLFAFDVFNPDVTILARPPGRRFPVMTVTGGALGRVTVESTHDYDAATQVDRSTWYISTAEATDKWIVPLPVRSIFPQELPLLLDASGLRLVRRFGDLTSQPFAATSPRQVCICTAA